MILKDPDMTGYFWQEVASEILRLSRTFTTSTQACPRGVLVSFPCSPCDACGFCPGLRQLQGRRPLTIHEDPP
jgi:hypothetical protein